MTATTNRISVAAARPGVAADSMPDSSAARQEARLGILAKRREFVEGLLQDRADARTPP